MKAKKILLSLMAIAAAVSMSAQVNEMKVRVNKPGAEIQPTMYGIFIEDINFAADGGLYAELVMNRSFEFPNNRLQGWNVVGRLEDRYRPIFRQGRSIHDEQRRNDCR